ncbi:MAG: DMT family transporter, partial [Candidatus Methanomethylophilaceae archaeon]|nr:DMT family transporter [Candidatus Methanomethylophilaceae archaeon]
DMNVLGVAIGLLSGVTLAAFTIGSKYVGERGYSENSAMFYFFLFSALLIMPFSDSGCIFSAAAGSPLIPVCILTMGVMCTLLPNYIIVYAVRRVDPAAVSIIITSSLIVSTICGVLVFGDEFGITDVIGIVLVMAAIIILEPPESLKRRFGKPAGR